MGGLEVLFWIALIVFSMLRGLQANKKRPPANSSPNNAPQGSDPLQDAIREIEAALRGEPYPPQQESQQPVEVSPKKDPIPEIKSSKPTYEPEFHTMESSIPSRELESKTTFSETYSDRTLEKKTTYGDSFRQYEYYDDSFKHAHPEEKSAPPSEEPTQKVTEHPLRKRLRNRDSLAEAIVLQTILNRRTFPPGRNRLDS